MKNRKSFYLLIFFILLVCLASISLLVGKNALTPTEVLAVLFGKSSKAQELLLLQFRLPRMLVAVLAGFGLAAAGFLLQGVTRNDLADSSILGINSGAGLFVFLYLGFLSNGTRPWLLPLAACFGSFLSAGLVYFCSYRRSIGVNINRLLLSGIAVNAGISALTLFLTIRVSKNSYTFIASWLAGSIWGSSWQYVQVLIIGMLVLLPLSLLEIRSLEVMSFGEEAAISLGVAVNRHRTISLILAILLAGISVSVAGSIAFVGLIAPHIAKNILGNRSKAAFGLCCMVGSLLVLSGDIMGRILLPSGEVPAGILVALIGAPYFIYILMKNNH